MSDSIRPPHSPVVKKPFFIFNWATVKRGLSQDLNPFVLRMCATSSQMADAIM